LRGVATFGFRFLQVHVFLMYTFTSCRHGQINHLFHMLLYVRDNEETSCVKLAYFVDGDEGIPSELEANAKSEFCVPAYLLQKHTTFTIKLFFMQS
jgi:hypothetical protein